MGKAAAKSVVNKNGDKSKPAISKLGRDLRKIRERIIASGLKRLTRAEIEREVAEGRGAR